MSSLEPLQQSVLGVSLDSGLMEGITWSVTRPDGGSIREFAKWNGDGASD